MLGDCGEPLVYASWKHESTLFDAASMLLGDLKVQLGVAALGRGCVFLLKVRVWTA